MKKLVLLFIIVSMFSVGIFAATGDATTNVNQAILDNYTKCTEVWLTGLAPLPIKIKVADIEKLGISKDGTLTIFGKETADGSKFDFWQVQFFATQVNIKQKTTKGVKTSVMTVITGAVGGGGKMF